MEVINFNQKKYVIKGLTQYQKNVSVTLDNFCLASSATLYLESDSIDLKVKQNFSPNQIVSFKIPDDMLAVSGSITGIISDDNNDVIVRISANVEERTDPSLFVFDGIPMGENILQGITYPSTSNTIVSADPRGSGYAAMSGINSMVLNSFDPDCFMVAANSGLKYITQQANKVYNAIYLCKKGAQSFDVNYTVKKSTGETQTGKYAANATSNGYYIYLMCYTETQPSDGKYFTGLPQYAQYIGDTDIRDYLKSLGQ